MEVSKLLDQLEQQIIPESRAKLAHANNEVEAQLFKTEFLQSMQKLFSNDTASITDVSLEESKDEQPFAVKIYHTGKAFAETVNLI